MRVGPGRAWQQVTHGSAEHEIRPNEEQRQDNAAEQDDHHEAWAFAAVARIRRYAMDKWLNHISLDAWLCGCAACRPGVFWLRLKAGRLGGPSLFPLVN